MTETKLTDADLGALGGWLLARETWTYASADGPTGTFTVAADVTTKYSPGMRVKLTQTTVKYFIITAVSTFSGGNTTITVYGGTDYTLANAAISLNYYSVVNAPAGFNLDPAKWTETFSSTTGPSQATPTSGVWYNLGTSKLDIPIGAWRVFYHAIVDEVATATNITVVPRVTLSTANNSESDATLTTVQWGLGNTSNTGRVLCSMSREKNITVAAKTSYFLNARCSGASINNIDFRGDIATTVIKAVCAYL